MRELRVFQCLSMDVRFDCDVEGTLDLYGLGVVFADHVERCGVGIGLDLVDGFAAGDDACDGGMSEAPGQGPLTHWDGVGDFGADLLDLVDKCFILGPGFPVGSHIVGGEADGLVLVHDRDVLLPPRARGETRAGVRVF